MDTFSLPPKQLYMLNDKKDNMEATDCLVKIGFGILAVKTHLAVLTWTIIVYMM